MSALDRRIVSASALFAAVLLSTLSSGQALAQEPEEVHSVRSDVRLDAFDEEARTITVTVLDPGRSNPDPALAKRKRVVFDVQLQGGALERTTVSLGGARGTLEDVPVGQSLRLYWIPDADRPSGRFAQRIDVAANGVESP